MSAPYPIPEELLARQREASDPALSAWVSANAGSGKTHVLAQRVIRLLLGGTPPGKILCLTFTKAAAANMSATVSETLARWTALDDDALANAVHALATEWPSPPRRAAARRLFAQALETPGGLKVQTIHAFCARLLQQFPFEANVPARFGVLDEASESQLLEELILDVLLEGSAAPDGPIGRALATIIASATDFTFREVLSEAIRKRDALTGWIERAGGIAAAIAQLSAELGLAAGETVEGIEAEFFSGDLIAPAQWPAVAAALAQGGRRDQQQSTRFGRLAAISATERIEAYLSIFLTVEGRPRANLVTRAIRDRHPNLFERLMAEQNRVCKLLERRQAAGARDRTHALVTIAITVIDRYRAQKDRRGLLDYDDLIAKSSALLAQVEAAWVHYKLDLGIDHVLIDEAQDTSPRQWEVIERLIAEFAAGEGARGTLGRTIFAVGDDKQSIFSFQGALPAAFAEKRRNFKRVYEAAGLRFRPIEFKHSFRSAPIVLEAVDRVFRLPEAFRGLADPAPTVHEAVRRAAPGLVEIWPLIEPTKAGAIEGWDAPFDATSETSPRVELARRIAGSVADWIARGVTVGDGERRHAATPGDFLVLVRQRGPLFEAIIRALKNAGIAVAGADRLVLTEHIAVMDLLTLADALLLPDDDLALATVLKSPLFGLEEDQLFALAHGRRGSLQSALRQQAASTPAFSQAVARLDRLAAAARHETPFAFYARVLGPEGGRRSFLARLGPEAGDALDELLNIALDHERRETPSLQGFVAWLRSANAEIKRDMEISRDEVRVMTVHGAKGLEAPIVILGDTTTLPGGPPQRQPRLLELSRKGAAPDAPGLLVWAARKGEVARVDAARQAMIEAAEREHLRLLYVAMTRAADRLVICGATGERGKPAGCWYDLVHAALLDGAAEEPADHGEGTVWRHRGGPLAEGTAKALGDPGHPRERPSWLDQEAPPEALPARGLSPSHAHQESPVSRIGGGGMERRKALVRGEVMHRLLQSLPAIAPERRAEAAGRYLARFSQTFTADELAQMMAQIRRVLEDPRFSDLFGPASLAEVPIVGRLAAAAAAIPVSGQVDRLAVTGAGVLIADYKTNRRPPRRLEDVPPAYVTQLAIYRAVLGSIYPDRPIRAILLWTEVPDLMEIPAPSLDRAIRTLTSP
jgi:ATP-dependent helicase/nuclease subunit A